MARKKAATTKKPAKTGASAERRHGHAYWSGQIKIALIYMPVQLVNAVQRTATIDLDLLDRKSGERIHHANVLENGEAVEDEDIVRGYETDKGYIYLEKEELQSVKLPSSDILELEQFVEANTLPFTHLEKPLYVVPTGKGGEEIYVTLRDALLDSGKIGIGQLTVRGREELCALLPYENGLVIELLRYEKELRDPGNFFSDFSDRKVKAANVKMAQELIEQLSEPLDLSRYEDHYHEAMMELINSKQAKRKPHYVTAKAKPKNVINLMDALRKSLKSTENEKRRPARRKAA